MGFVKLLDVSPLGIPSGVCPLVENGGLLETKK